MEFFFQNENNKTEEQKEGVRWSTEKIKERRIRKDTPESIYGPLLEPDWNNPPKWETVKEP